MTARAIVSANAVPRRGGQGLNLHQMLEGVESRFETTLFCRSGGQSRIAVPPSKAARLIARVPALRRRRDWQTALEDVAFDRYVAERIRPVELFQGATGQCLESLRRAKADGGATIVDVVTAHVDVFGAAQDKECARFGVRVATSNRMRERIRAEYATADGVRVMSEVARSTFLERGFDPRRVSVISPFFDLHGLEPARFDGARFRVSFVGLIEPWKGFHYLLEAFERLALPEAELVFWGGPGARPITAYLTERRAANTAIRIEPVEVQAVGFDRVYGSSHVLVQPSLADGFGYVVAEAMACGVPVIVTSATGAADLVEDGVSGYVVPPGDSDEIAARLRHLYDHPSLVREMGAAARRSVSAYTRERFLDQYARCFETFGLASSAREASRATR